MKLLKDLAPLTAVPELAGLGALAVAVFIDNNSSSPAERSTQEALRSVFAEEKVSKVWDLIDECLKRAVIFINQREELVNNIRELERQLSAAITSLKNSMVNDGHMSTQALKVWVNGAAFHLQMIIHLVRLGGIPTSDPAERLVDTYQSDLVTLFRLQEEMIKGKCRLKVVGLRGCCLMDEESGAHQMDPSIIFHSIIDRSIIDRSITDRPINQRSINQRSIIERSITDRSIRDLYKEYLHAYYDQRYGEQQRDIQRYFTKLREDLPSLVRLTGSVPFRSTN